MSDAPKHPAHVVFPRPGYDLPSDENERRRNAIAAAPTPAPWKWSVDSMSNHADQSLGHACPDVGHGYQEVLLAEHVRPADRALIAAAPEMLAMLRKLESFEDRSLNGLRTCPRCFGAVEYQHRPNCDLADLLARIDGAAGT